MRLRGGTDTNNTNMAGGEPEDETTPGGTVTADERMLQETLNGISELRAESERRISELIAEYYRELKAKVTEIDGAGLGRHPHAVHIRTYIYIYIPQPPFTIVHTQAAMILICSRSTYCSTLKNKIYDEYGRKNK